VLELYRAPLRVAGWAEALAAALGSLPVGETAAAAAVSGDVADCAARRLPCLLLTGEHDRMAPPAKVGRMGGLRAWGLALGMGLRGRVATLCSDVLLNECGGRAGVLKRLPRRASLGPLYG
jgi:hypothetical protein